MNEKKKENMELAPKTPETANPFGMMRRFTKENEEMRRGAVWFVGARHRHDAANVFDETGFVRQAARHAFG